MNGRQKIIRFYTWRLLLAVIFLPALALAAQPAEQTDITRATLNNGMRVVIVRNTLAPVVTTEINYIVGSIEAPAGFPGTAHALEHMMFRGSPGLSSAQLSNLIAAMGGHFNAATQQVVTQYYFTVPASDLDLALNIEAIRMRGLSSTEELWRQERGAIEQEVAQDLSNPQYLFYSRLLSVMFAGTPYQHDALGSRPSFQKTTGKMLKDFHQQWYAPNNAILVVAGDVDPAAALASIKKLFEPIPRRPLPARPKVELKPVKAQKIAIDSDLPYGLAAVAYRLPGYDDPDFAAAVVLADALDSQRADLYALAAEGKALAAGFEGMMLPKAGFGYANAVFPRGQDSSGLIADMQQAIAAYVKNGIPEDLVEATKRREIADAEFRKNSIAGLAREWSQALAVEGRNSPDDDIEAIKRVTTADVNRVAQKYFDNQSAVVAVLTPRESGNPVVAEGARPGAESFAPKQAKPVPLPAWAKKNLSPLDVPESKVAPADMVLSNGIRLIVQPESISDTVIVQGAVKNRPELEVPPGKEGVDQILDDLFSYGTTHLDRIAYQTALDEIAAQVNVGTRFSLQVLADRFERGMELLSDNLLHPALPENAFKAVKQRTRQAVAGRLQSPIYLSQRALLQAIYPANDPTLRQATPDSVDTIDLDGVRAYHQKVFRPDLTTIVVIGKVTPEQAKNAVEKFFGDWKAEGPKPETDLPPVPRNKGGFVVVPDRTRVQDDVTLGQTFELKRQDPDYYPLQLGINVLSGAFYATRLYRDLRENTGLVYSVGAALQSSKTRSVFYVSYACDPQNVGKARAIVERNLRDMQTKPVNAEELLQAKTLLVRGIPLAESSISGIAGELVQRSLLDLPLDEAVRAARRYKDMTANEVQTAFAKWLKVNDLAEVVTGPQPK